MLALLLLINDEAQQYFQRAILMSGALMLRYQKNDHRCFVNVMAEQLTTQIRNDTDSIELLKQMPAEQLLAFSSRIAKRFHPTLSIWCPLIEGTMAKRIIWFLIAALIVSFSLVFVNQ